MTRIEEGLFTELEVREFLDRVEGQFLEFKSLWDQTPGSVKPLD